MARTSILREALKNLLQQYHATGISFADIEQRFGSMDKRRLLKLLSNMRTYDQAHCKRVAGCRSGQWFPGPDPSAPAGLRQSEWLRVKRARLADQAAPIAFYGQQLAGGRCASVWEYARHHQEQAA